MKKYELIMTRKEVEKAKSYMLEKYGERPKIKDFEEEGK